MRPQWTVPPSELSGPDARIPGVAIRAVLVIAGMLLSVVDYRLTGWLVIGFTLSGAAALVPRSLAGWALILFLAAGELAHHPGLNVRFLVLLAGLHLLHILAMLTLELPWRAWVQPAVLAAPLVRFLVIQVPSQLVAVLGLLLLAPGGHGQRPLTVVWFAAVGAAAVAGLALLLLGPRLDEG